MKKIVITTNEKKKINYINNLNCNDICLVLFKNESHILEKISNINNYIFVEDLTNAVFFLDFQTKISNKTLIIYNCLRYKQHNATLYNRIYTLTDSTDNIIVINDFPFVFDKRNVFIALKMIKEMKYHYKQWYDDDFYENQTQVNSIGYIYEKYKDFFIVESNNINYTIHEWHHTNEEEQAYQGKKHRVIYEKEYSKIKVMTSLSGFVNRMRTKKEKLFSLFDNKKYLVIMNWERGMNEIKEMNKRMFGNFELTSYHLNQNNFKIDEVIFFETIISQKIKFYDMLKYYINKPLHFFINENIGIDKISTNETVNLIMDLNNFYEKAWENI